MKQRYSITFDDIQGRQVDVAVYGRDWTGGVTELTGGASPLTLDEDDAEGIDTPCRAWTGSLTVMTEDGVDYSGLYAADVTDVRVEVRREGSLVWQGYVSPEVMRQSWVAGDELTVSVQSPLAALSGLTLDASAGFGFPTLGGLLAEALALTGDWDTVTFPADLSVPGRTGLDTWLDLTVSRMAFFTREYDESEWDEGDVARIVYQGATGREVVEAVARLTGWTARERGRTLWLTAESVSAYITVAAGELGTAGRATTVVAAPTVSLDGMQPAGTDHTVSQLRGYRRVRVTFDAARTESLLPANDIHNWEPMTAYTLAEDFKFKGDPDTGDERQMYYVTRTDWIPDGGSFTPSRGINYQFALYKQISVDNYSRTYLYGLYYSGLENGSQIWNSGSFPTYQGQPVIPLHRWSGQIMINGANRTASYAGAARAWMTWAEADLAQGTGAQDLIFSDKNESTRASCYVVFTAANKNYPFRIGYSSFPYQEDLKRGIYVKIIELHSVEIYSLYDCGLKLTGEFSAFISQGIKALHSTGYFPNDRMDSMGPYAFTHEWPMRLSVGDKYWNGTYWQSEECDFVADLTAEPGAGSANFAPSGRADDLEKYGDDSAYIIPLIDDTGEAITLSGEAVFTLYMPNVPYGPIQTGQGILIEQNQYNPIIIRNLDIIPIGIVERVKGFPYRDEGEDEPDAEHVYLALTGYKGTEDVYDVDESLGTANNDVCATNVLIDGTAPLRALTSARQGGRTARPERLVLGVLQRLYGRARQQLSVEVEAAELWPSVTVMDGAARYALTGVHWDVREARATYVLEDFVPFDEWRAGR